MANKYYRVEFTSVKTGKSYDTSEKNYGDNFKNDYYDHFLKSYFTVLDEINLPIDFLVSVTNQIIAMGEMYTDILMEAIDTDNNIDLFKVTKNEKHKNYKIPVKLMGEFLQSFDEHNQFIYFDNGAILWEVFLEKVRAKEFSNLPSRMESIFLFDSNTSCNYYKQNHIGGKGNVVEIALIETRNVFEADMQIIDDIENSISRDELLETVRMYWRGEKSANPIMEIIFQGTYKF